MNGVVAELLISYCMSNRFKKGFQCFPIPLLACALSFEEPFGLPRGELNFLDVGESASFLSTDFRGGYSMHFNQFSSHNTIHWQIRYFSPMLGSIDNDENCLLSKRQAATIRRGSEKVWLQEKRARISFRVLKEIPELFSILVLTDEDTFPDTYDPDKKFEFGRLWNRYAFIRSRGIAPNEQFLYEICRVFKICMDAWGQTLDIIDELVHVKVSCKMHLAVPFHELMSFTNTFASWMTLIAMHGWRTSCSIILSNVPKTTLLLSNYLELLTSG